MAILLGPKPTHHPSCPARYDAPGCICPAQVDIGEGGTAAPVATAEASAHGAVTGAVSLRDAQLLEEESASLTRYLEVRQARVDAQRLVGVA